MLVVILLKKKPPFDTSVLRFFAMYADYAYLRKLFRDLFLKQGFQVGFYVRWSRVGWLDVSPFNTLLHSATSLSGALTRLLHSFG